MANGNSFKANLALTDRVYEVRATLTQLRRGPAVKFRIVRDMGANLMAGQPGTPDHCQARVVSHLLLGGTTTVLATAFWGWERVATLSDQTLQARIAAAQAAPKRADGRVDCPACGHHGSHCQEDLDNGTTICHSTGLAVAL